MGGPMNPIAGWPQDPLQQLAIAVRHAAEVPQGHEASLEVFDSGFTMPFFFGSAGGQGEMREAVKLRRHPHKSGEYGIIKTRRYKRR